MYSTEKGEDVTDLFIESLALQRIQLIARVGAMDVCNGDDKETALVWINELAHELLEQLGNDGHRGIVPTRQLSPNLAQQHLTANYQR